MKLLKRNRRYFCTDINSVKKGTAYLSQITGYRPRSAGTTVQIRIITAGTGIHGCAQHEICRKRVGSAYPGNMNHLILQRLPEKFQTTSGKLRHLIQKQHTPVGQRNLTGSWIASPTGQRIGSACMMRTAERSLVDQRMVSGQEPRNTIYFGKLQLLFKAYSRHNRRQPSGKHSFSGSRRSYKQYIMKSTHCNFCCPLCTFLSFNVRKIQLIPFLSGFRFLLLFSLYIGFRII